MRLPCRAANPKGSFESRLCEEFDDRRHTGLVFFAWMLPMLRVHWEISGSTTVVSIPSVEKAERRVGAALGSSSAQAVSSVPRNDDNPPPSMMHSFNLSCRNERIIFIDAAARAEGFSLQ